MRRKWLSLILVLSLFVTPFLPADVFASEATAEAPKEIKKQAASAFEQAIKKGEDGKYEIDGMTVNLKKLYATVDKKNKTVEIHDEKPVTSQKKIRWEAVELAWGVTFIPPPRENNGYPGDGYVLTQFMVVDTDGIGALNIKADIDVNTSNELYSSYDEDFAAINVDWNWFQYSEGEVVNELTKVENTKFYQVNTDITVDFLFESDDYSETMGPLLANKKAFEYPCEYYDPADNTLPPKCHGDSLNPQLYEDPFSDKVMFMPATTQMKVVPPEDRVQWDNEKRGAYIKQYIEMYGDPKKKDPSFNWSDYDIHHIIPREYGGKNNFANLIPLKREFHQKNVTPWWTNY